MESWFGRILKSKDRSLSAWVKIWVAVCEYGVDKSHYMLTAKVAAIRTSAIDSWCPAWIMDVKEVR